jgi:hypothetical protein
VAEMLAPWQHCLAGRILLIGKPMQLEKKDTAKSRIGAAKSKRIPQNTLLIGKSLLNCGVHFEMRSRQCINMLNFVYEENIKIQDKYFATI